jgi:HK97 family phage portal protein
MSFLGRLLPEREAAASEAPERRYLTGSAFVPPPQSGVLGDVVGEFRAMSHMAVFACVRLLADTIAAMPWYVYRRDANNLPKRVYPTPKIIRKPCPEMDLFQWKWMVVATLALRGNSYHMVTTRDNQETPTGLMPLHPDLVFVERRTDILRWFDPIYRVMGDRISTEDMIHIRRFTLPGQPVGLTPIQQAAHAIGIGLSAEQYGLRYFQDSANPSGILRTDNSLTDDEVERNQKQWIASHGGHRFPAVLSGGFDWKSIAITPEESQFLETRKYQRSEIAMMYGIPPHMIGDVERSTSWGTGIEAQSMGFATYTLMGWTACIESMMGECLPAGQFVKFDTNGLLRADIKTRYESYKMARETGWMSANDIRQREELPPIDEGDGYLQPLNFGPLGAEPESDDDEPQDTPDEPTGDSPSGQEPAPAGIGATNGRTKERIQ